MELTGLFVCYVCTVIQIYPIYLLFAFLQQALELFGNWSWVLQKQLNSGSFWKPPSPFDTWPTLCPGPTGDSQHHLQVLKFKKTSKCWIILVNITLKTWNKYLIQQNNVKKWKFINKTTECVSQTVWSFRGLLIIKLRVHFHPICYIGILWCALSAGILT